MSHRIGTLQVVSFATTIDPDSALPATALTAFARSRFGLREGRTEGALWLRERAPVSMLIGSAIVLASVGFVLRAGSKTEEPIRYSSKRFPRHRPR